jgi:hypothetical protein
VFASVAILFHLSALVAGCLAARPSSALEVAIFELFRPYCDVIYQGVGYRFYSRLDTTVDPAHPQPWGTPIVIAEMDFDAPGTKTRTETIRLPDSAPVWPHLRQQRQIDLAFHLALDPRWAASCARHLCKSRGCDRVTIHAQGHYIPDVDRLRKESGSVTPAMLDPDDGSTYGPRIKLGEFRCSDFSQQ